MSDSELTALSEGVGKALRARGWRMATAESCTGGWVAKLVTDTSGSSQWLDRGFVTYSNAAKQEMLGVRPETLERFGAVSEQTVREMVCGALRRSCADVAVAISGVAGPTGGTLEKPVGTVWLAWATRHEAVEARRVLCAGNRDAIRRHAVVAALDGVRARALAGGPKSGDLG